MGRSADSAFSSEYHFFHYKYSVSKDWQIPANKGIYSKALQEAQILSFKKDLSTSGTCPGLGSYLPITRWLTYSVLSSPDLSNTLRVKIEATISLCLSNNPLLVFWKAV